MSCSASSSSAVFVFETTPVQRAMKLRPTRFGMTRNACTLLMLLVMVMQLSSPISCVPTHIRVNLDEVDEVQMHTQALSSSNFTVSPFVLLTSLADAHDVSGLIIPRGSTLAEVPGNLKSPCNESLTLYAGILANATFELFTLEVAPAPATTGYVVRRYLSNDLRSYSAPTLVVPLVGTNFTHAAVAKDNSTTGGYLLLAVEPIAGDAKNRSQVLSFHSKDGLTWAASSGSGYTIDAGCAHTGLIKHPTLGWLSFQRVLQTLSKPKAFPDSVGPDRRRAVAVMASQDDGVTWLRLDTGATGLFLPGPQDPPEMELGAGAFGFQPFWYGNKLAAIATNYIPSLVPVGPPPAPSPPPPPAPVNKSVVPPTLQPTDGPISAQEWWVASSVGASVQPGDATNWIRPYTAQTQLSGNAGIAGQAAAPMGFMMTHAPLMVAQTVMPTPGWPSDGMFWLYRGAWLGLMNWRIGGLYSPGNSVFTTDVFTMPTDTQTDYLWLDVDSRWGVRTPVDCDGADDEQCQAYVMVELLPPTSDTPYTGYEKDNCNLARTHMHASEQGMPLTWSPVPPAPKPTPLSGKDVRARIYMRDTTVFAIGAGNSW